MQNYTYNDILNQFANHAMSREVMFGVRDLSYEKFKRKAREHQIAFRENELQVEFHKYPHVLNDVDGKKGLIFFGGFRGEIMQELQKTIASTSSTPSNQMLTNLLRSEHIPYNIFFPMKKDLDGTCQLFSRILGKEIQEVMDVLIEYHPEPKKEYLDDHTAFDVYIPYFNKTMQPCGIGIEVKYTESSYPLKVNSREYRHVKDENGKTHISGAYAKVTECCGYYKEDVSYDTLVSNKFRQIWRNHMLGASMVLRGDLSEFTSITLYPQGNVHFSMDAMPTYKKFLNNEHRNTCIPLSYEHLFEMMSCYLHIAQKEEWIAYLKRRYLINYFSQLFN